MPSRVEQLSEFVKCSNDPIYAIENYLKTFDKTQEGFVQFKLFPKQKELINALQNYKHNLAKKYRQAGVSTTAAAFASTQISFASEDNPEKILILANKQDLAQEILKKVKDFVEQYPDWMGIELTTNSKKNIILNNGSECRALATSIDALRGYTPTVLIMDEAAFIENGVEVFIAALGALGTGGKILLCSTPNGLDPLYYQTYDLSRLGKNDFNIIEMHWYQDPRYNKNLKWIKDGEEVIEIDFTYEGFQKMVLDGYKPTSPWYEEMCRQMNGNERLIAQELDGKFVGSGGNVVDSDYIEFHNREYVKPPNRVEGFEKNIWIWEEPKDGHQYILASDVSRGDGEDFSTITILDFTDGDQVLEYCGKIPPDMLAELIYEYGNRYAAYTVIDITGGMGVTTVLKLLEMGYKYLHYDDPRSKVLSNKSEFSKYKKDQNKIPGFNVGANRLNMIAELEKSIRLNEIKIRSIRLISELNTFVFKNGRPDHAEGAHDDCIMALAMCLWIIQTSFKNLEKLNSQTKALLGGWIVSEAPSPTIINPNGNAVPKDYIDNMWLFMK